MKKEYSRPEITDQIRRYADAYIKQVVNYSQKGFFKVKYKHTNYGIEFESFNENICYGAKYTDEIVVHSRKIVVGNAVIGIDSEELYEALLLLTEKQREVLIKNIVLDIPASQIASQMGIRTNKVYKHRTAALNKIRRYLSWDK